MSFGRLIISIGNTALAAVWIGGLALPPAFAQTNQMTEARQLFKPNSIDTTSTAR